MLPIIIKYSLCEYNIDMFAVQIRIATFDCATLLSPSVVKSCCKHLNDTKTGEIKV